MTAHPGLGRSLPPAQVLQQDSAEGQAYEGQGVVRVPAQPGHQDHACCRDTEERDVSLDQAWQIPLSLGLLHPYTLPGNSRTGLSLKGALRGPVFLSSSAL